MRAGIDPPHHAAALQNSPEDLELRAAQRLAEVADLHPEPHVRTVGPEAGDRLVVGEARERSGQIHTAGRERRPKDALRGSHHVLLLDERHLDVELGELELAVGAQRLVPEAAGDLVVALEARDHQELLEELRRLRQRVESAALHARRDHEVTCALGRGARQDRRLDVDEPRGVQVVADRLHDPVSQLQRTLHGLATQVEVAVAQAQRLVDGRVLVDRERQASRRGQARKARSPAPRPRPWACPG